MTKARSRSPAQWAVVLVAGLLGACSSEPAVGPDQASPPQPSFAPLSQAQATRTYVVEIASTKVTAATAAISAAGGKIERTAAATGLYEVSGLDQTKAAQLRSAVGVLGIAGDIRQQFVRPFTSTHRANTSPRSGVRAQGTDQSGAFFFPFQWNIRQIAANKAWTATPAGEGALVCVLDTGVDPGQLDLAGKVDLTRSTSMVVSEPFIEDLHFHGTYVSSLISANGIGMASVASDAKLCAVKVLDQTGSGSFFDIMLGIVYAADHGADVINMSLGGYLDVGTGDGRFFLKQLQQVIEFARSKGALVVASSGNDGVDLDLFPTIRVIPAQVLGVVGVSATAPFNQERFDAIAPYSNIGTTLVDFAAPGGDFLPGGVILDLVLGACSRYVCGQDGIYIFAAGTSAAAPHVAAAGAVVESNKSGNQTGDALIECLAAGAKKLGGVPTKQQGNGRVDVLRAATAAC